MNANTTEVVIVQNTVASCVKSVLTTIAGKTGGAIIAATDPKTKKKCVFEMLPTLNNLSERKEALNRVSTWMKSKSGKYDMAWFCTTRNENRAACIACEMYDGDPIKKYFTVAPRRPVPIKKKA